MLKIKDEDKILSYDVNDSINSNEMEDEGFFYDEINKRLIVINATALFIYKEFLNLINSNIQLIEINYFVNKIVENFESCIDENIILNDIRKAFNDFIKEHIIIKS